MHITKITSEILLVPFMLNRSSVQKFEDDVTMKSLRNVMNLDETVVIVAGLKFSYWCEEVEKAFTPSKQVIINLLRDKSLM